jgi:TonB family protein
MPGLASNTKQGLFLVSVKTALGHLTMFLLVLAITAEVNGGTNQPRGFTAQSRRSPTLAILDLGDSSFGRTTADALLLSAKRTAEFVTLDRDQARTAAHGAAYGGSINLSINEARNLGAALGCDFFILGDAQTVRRSPSSGPVYFESYASIFLVSARSGRLAMWERPSFKAESATASAQLLLAELASNQLQSRIGVATRRAEDDERNERELKPDEEAVPLIEEAPDDDKTAAAEGLRLPKPYRRFLPPYPETAALAEAEATVDVLVDLDASGEVSRVEVARWAGFGLDQATIDTVRRLHFFPAMKNGVPIPIRVLLRYNFRKPPR